MALPLLQDPTGGHVLLVRTTGDPLALAAPITSVIRALDPALPITTVKTLESLRQLQLGPQQASARLLAVFGVLGLIVALGGGAAVLSAVLVARRTELAVRIALGASPGRMRWLVAREGVLLAISGIGVGMLAYIWAGPFLRDRFDGFEAAPLPILFGVGAAILIAVTSVSLASSGHVSRMNTSTVLQQG